MTDEEILAELSNNEGKTIVVQNTWYFTGKSMGCTGMTEDYACCSDYYDTFEEALAVIRDLAADTQPKVL